MIVRVLLFCPASLGVAIVVAWTASTVPARRTLRTKSIFFTMVVEGVADGDCSGTRARSDRPATPTATATAAATRIRGFFMT